MLRDYYLDIKSRIDNLEEGMGICISYLDVIPTLVAKNPVYQIKQVGEDRYKLKVLWLEEIGISSVQTVIEGFRCEFKNSNWEKKDSFRVTYDCFLRDSIVSKYKCYVGLPKSLPERDILYMKLDSWGSRF